MEDRLNVFIDFARPPKPERRRVDLETVVAETLALVGGRARKQRVALNSTPPTTPVEVEADGEQIRQLLVNLALNALDVMPRGGMLEIELRPPSDGHVELACSTPGRASRLGTCPGSTSRSSPARRPGWAWAWSSPSGSRTTTAAPSGRRTGRRAGPASSSACQQRQGPRLGIFSEIDMANILVIDDETSILHAFRRAFADPEDTLLTASDGSEGLELVSRCRPDVVVLDLNLPDSPAWTCSTGSARSTPASRSSSSPATGRPRRPSRR